MGPQQCPPTVAADIPLRGPPLNLCVLGHKRMYDNRFSAWNPWPRRDETLGVSYPGVYVLAYSGRNIAGKPFSWRKEIVYVGMTNAVSGLKGRLRQFDNTILGKSGHGGADRVRYKHRNYCSLVKRLFVAVAPFKCDPRSTRPKDLRIMGEVAEFEYLCFAHFVEKYGVLPEFNNKKASPKYSLSAGTK